MLLRFENMLKTELITHLICQLIFQNGRMNLEINMCCLCGHIRQLPR